MALSLRFIAGRYTIARPPPDSSIPGWACGPGFSAIVRADDELTIVCMEDRVPDSVESEPGWACLRTIGPFDFQAAGIVHSLITPLSTHGIGVFVVCTFDGEHLLVAESDRIKARDLLLAAGHEFFHES
ncbi:MAG: ACT domain-containing protein [Castellaniella sp.]|uniref:ACT domain-containing protein n=1 Tax=Castellaniella sp. TaxID=1955812 RepID=UPI003C7872AC